MDTPIFGSGEPHQLFARLNLGGYVHPRAYWALMATGEIGYRATASFGLFGEIAGGIGYEHTFLASSVYQVGDDGSVSSASNAGKPGFIEGVTLGVGWDLRPATSLPIAVALRPQVWWLTPYNASSALTRFGASLGVTYSF